MSDQSERAYHGSSWDDVVNVLFDFRGHCFAASPDEDLGFRLVEEVEKQREIRRAERGGSWFFTPAFARVAYHYWNPPSDRSSYLGFRLVEEQGGVQ